MVTSRVLLQLRGERAFPVAPLPVPEVGYAPALAELAASPAVQLFVERAQDARADFVLTRENAAEVVQICERLDGLPLAIELAAARTRVLSPQAILARFGSRLALLGESAGGPARQRTLRDTIAWSYDLLAPAERALFRRLAVFVGGFTLDAADTVADAGHGLGVDILDGVASLVDKSLLRRLPELGGEPRFGMLETIREFAQEQLEVSTDAAETHQRHAAWCVALAERGQADDRRLFEGNPHRLQLLESEMANLRAGLTWLTREGNSQTMLRLAAALAPFWNVRSHLSDGQLWLEQALARDDGAQPALRISALLVLSQLLGQRGDAPRATALLDEALSLARATGDTIGAAYTVVCQGFFTLHAQGDVTLAAAKSEEGLALCKALGIPGGIGAARYLLAQIALRGGDPALATTRLEQLVHDFREHEADDYILMMTLHDLGVLAHARHDNAQAIAYYSDALARCWAIGDLGKVAWCLEGVAAAAGQEHPEQAARLFSAADALRITIATPLLPVEIPDHERALASIRAALGEPAFAAAWLAGTVLPMEAAIAGARSLAAGIPAV
jgi:predicted ATPase